MEMIGVDATKDTISLQDYHRFVTISRTGIQSQNTAKKVCRKYYEIGKLTHSVYEELRIKVMRRTTE